MSNSRRSRPVRYRRTEPSNEMVSVITAWCDGPDMLEDCKKESHDRLIALLGDRRTSGVSWRILDNVDKALEVLERMREGASQANLDVYGHVEGLLREHGGILVIAMASDIPPAADPRNN